VSASIGEQASRRRFFQGCVIEQATMAPYERGCTKVIGLDALGQLLDALKSLGYALVGPTVRDQAIVYDAIDSVGELPVGWTDEQGPGRYRLRRSEGAAVFGYVVGPHSWKQHLFPPTERLWQVSLPENGDASDLSAESVPDTKVALIGVRACELEAIHIQDAVFLDGPYVDTRYEVRRRNVFIIAVNCAHAAETCFCASMGTGPRAGHGFDLALTEVMDGACHEFTIEVGSDIGAEVLDRLTHRDARPEDLQAAAAATSGAESQIKRRLETDGIKELLYRNLEHPRWDIVAERCQGCANCTTVCPTCFCATVEDVTDLSGQRAERWRRWDSCFTMDFSYIVGGSIRSSPRSRYRQWMTHKLASWHEQFGSSGCVGCGRCITWCPVGIDITEEAAAIRETDGAAARRAALQEHES